MSKKLNYIVHASIAALSLGFATSALAQDEASDNEFEIIVTGSSLKGVAPVGSSVVTVSRDDLEKSGAQTVQQILQSVPAVVGNGTSAQGGFGSFDGSGTNAPTIHSLGASASNSTLILLNGHRLSVGGINHVLADPNIVAPLALERVEVLADGASSVYGSDAVAGVVNFITRRNVNGIEATVQKGFGDAYDTFTAGVLFGKTWDNGSALVSYNYSNRSDLLASDRDFTNPDHTAFGGTNQTNINSCQDPVFRSGNNYYMAPYTGSPLTAAQAKDAASGLASCDSRSFGDIVPAEVRHNAMFSIQQEVGDKLTLTGDIIYSNRKTTNLVQRGAVNGVDIYGSGAPSGNSNNPFFQAPAGSGATQGKLYFMSDGILGSGAHQDGIAETLYFRADADYKISDVWSLNVGAIYGRDRSRQDRIGELCSSCMNLALNGKTSASVAGSVQTVTMNLTAANAFDPFGNGTSDATKAFLTDSYQYTQAITQITNIYAGLSGDLFALPGGNAKIALGGEYTKYAMAQDKVSPTNLGPSSSNSAFLHLDYGRNVKSAYAELFLPLVGPDMDIPGIRRFELNIAGRIDDYSDFGSTKNPKIAANWEVVEGLKFRANWGKSFVAPALTSVGANEFGQTAESVYGAAGQVQVPYDTYPDAKLVPGCDPSATSCIFAIGGVRPGIQIAGGNANLKAQTGKSWSLGFDFTPVFAPGLRISATYWVNNLRGGVTAPSTGLVLTDPNLTSRLQIFPGGLTAGEIAAAVGTLPPGAPLDPGTKYFIFDFRQGNVVNLDVAGIDVDMNYRIDTDTMGTFNIGGGISRKTKFNGFGVGGSAYDALGTGGVFTTFQSIKLVGRAHVGWNYHGLDANAYVNYTGGYANRGLFGTDNTGYDVISDANGNKIGGGRPVSSFTTVDLNIGYTFEDVGPFRDTKIYLDVTNLLDQDPPFVNAAAGLNSGFDPFNASPIGRVVSVGLRTKL